MAEENKNHEMQTAPKKKKYFYFKKKKNPFKNSEEERKNFQKASVVIPLYNEEESLVPLYEELKKVFSANRSISFEIIFVDDGSNDKSLEIIKRLERIDNRVKYISFRKNYGKSAALQVGFSKAEGEAIITMDADLQDDPNEIPNLLAKLQEGYDLVSGWKKTRYDPFIKRTTSKFFNFVTRLFSGVKIHDFNCGLKAYRREVVENISLYGELHRYIPVLASWQGFKVGEIVVKHHPRKYGKTKFGISRFYKGFLDLLTVMLITRFIKRPLHLFGLIGLIFIFIGIVINAFLTYWWFLGRPLSSRPLLFLGMLLIIVGVQFFAIGLLGEMIANYQARVLDYSIKSQSSSYIKTSV